MPPHPKSYILHPSFPGGAVGRATLGALAGSSGGQGALGDAAAARTGISYGTCDGVRADGRAYVLLDGASGVLVLPVAAELPLALLVGRRVVVAGDDAATWLVVGLTGASVLNVANGLVQLDATGKVATALLSTNVANGVLQLDSSAKVPMARLYTNVANGVLQLDTSAKVPMTSLSTNVANGVAQLDAGGLVADTLLTTNVAKLNVAQTFTADQRFDGAVGVGVAPLATIGLRLNKIVTDPAAATSGITGVVLATLTANNAQDVTGFNGTVQMNTGGFVASGTAYGVQGQARNTGTGTLAEGIAIYAMTYASVAGGTMTTGYDFYAATPAAVGTIGTQYGLYIARQKVSANVTTGYGVYQAHNADINYFAGSVGIGTAGQFGSGVGVLALANAAVVPSVTPTGGGVLYVQAGSLRFRGSAGTVTTIAPA